MHKYIPVESVSDDASSLSTILEEPPEQPELERPRKVRFDVKPAESARGLLSKIYSSFTGGRTPGGAGSVQQECASANVPEPARKPPSREQQALKPALKKSKVTTPDQGPTFETAISSAILPRLDNEEAFEAMSQSMIISPGRGQVVREATTNAKDKGKGKLIMSTEESNDYVAQQHASF